MFGYSEYRARTQTNTGISPRAVSEQELTHPNVCFVALRVKLHPAGKGRVCNKLPGHAGTVARGRSHCLQAMTAKNALIITRKKNKKKEI
jgi:hypothetical protein